MSEIESDKKEFVASTDEEERCLVWAVRNGVQIMREERTGSL